MKAKSISGFTLIELLVALSVFSLMTVAIYSAFSAGIRARQKGEEASDTFQEARIILDRMSSEMRNMAPYSGCQFMGQKKLISFPTLLRKGDNLEIRCVTYEFRGEDKQQSGSLTRRDENLSGSTEEKILSSSTWQIEFDYGWESAKGGPIEWTDSWDPGSEEIYPAAIRIKLSLIQDDKQQTSLNRTIYVPVNTAMHKG